MPRGNHSPFFYILGVLVVVTFIVLVPALFAISQNWFAGFGLLLLIVPMVRVISDTLMGEIPAGFYSGFRTYVEVFLTLFFQSFVLTLMIPVIALQLIWAFAFLGLFVGVIGAAIGFVQVVLGWDLGAHMDNNDIYTMLGLAGLSLVIIVAGFFVSYLAKRHEELFWSFLRGFGEDLRLLIPRRKPGSGSTTS